MEEEGGASKGMLTVYSNPSLRIFTAWAGRYLGCLVSSIFAPPLHLSSLSFFLSLPRLPLQLLRLLLVLYRFPTFPLWLLCHFPIFPLLLHFRHPCQACCSILHCLHPLPHHCSATTVNKIIFFWIEVIDGKILSRQMRQHHTSRGGNDKIITS